MTQRLLPKHQKFVAAYLTGMGAGKAAVAAGYAEGNSRNRAAKLLKHPGVAAEIAKAQEKLREDSAYTATKAMDELNKAIEFAERTENATAVARLIELKMKLCGLLDDKSGGQAANFQINIMGFDGEPVKVIDHG